MPRRLAPLLVPFLLLLAACGVEAGDEVASGGTGTTTQGSPPGDAEAGAEAPGERTEADRVLSDAADATTGLDAFRSEATASLQIMGQDLELHGSGAMDFAELVGSFRTSVTTPSDEIDVEVRSDGATMWLKPKGSAIELPRGKAWVATTPEWLDDDHSLGAPSLLGVSLALKGSAGAIEGETKEIDGVEATEYTTTIGYDDVLAALGPDAPTFRRALSLEAPEPPDLDITVWIGSDGIVRDLHLVIVSDGAFAIGGTYDLSVRDVGEPVAEPDAPPADEVLTGPEAERIVQQLLR